MAFNFHYYIFKISLLYVVSSFTFSTSTPVISEVKVINETFFIDKNFTFSKIVVQFYGKYFTKEMRVRPTLYEDEFGDKCSKDKIFEKYEFVEEELYNNTSALMSIVFEIFDLPFVKLSLCVSDLQLRTSDDYGITINRIDEWLHQGKNVTFRTKNDKYNFENASSSIFFRENLKRIRRQDTNERTLYNSNLEKNLRRVHLYGLRLKYALPPADFERDGDAEPILLVDSIVTFYLFGSGWTNETIFVWTESINDCEYIIGEKTKISNDVNETASTIELEIRIPYPRNSNFSGNLYFCCRESDKDVYHHLGSHSYTRIKVKEILLPMWMQLVIISVCLSFSSLFSGLNLGLLSLNKTELMIISNTGTDAERRYAKAIYPVRLHGNYLLCSILLGNVLVNSIFTILLEDMFSGLVAVVLSTLCIVVVGEICPQAVCSRHGLAIGAKTIYITKTVMVLTAPLSWPLSHLLDKILGEEIVTTYTRERLKELVKVTTGDLEKDEVNIISGALELRKKTVGEVMTRIEDVYMLSYDTILDFETVSEIMKSGYSRIPVYEGTRRNIVSLLYIKDLALIDPDDNTPLKTLSQYYQNSCYYVFEDTTLDVVFKQFKDGCKGHMAFVHRVNNEGEGDPFYETVGIVTLEDVIEELIQAEIMDETDVYTDNRTKQRRSDRFLRNQDFSLFAERNENQRVHISPQLNLAAFQFLSSSVDAFKSENVSETVLLRLLKHDIIYHIKVRDKDNKDDPAYVIYLQGKPADYFVLILEGRVQVTVGRESLIFESGPFTYFGSQALIQNIGVVESPTNIAQPMGSLQSVNLESMLRHTFIPDYTVRAVTEVFYLLIKRSLYFAAKKATLMERSKKVSNAGEHFDDEVEKLLHNFGKGGSGDDDTKSQISREGSFNNPQNIQYIEDSARNSPVNQENVNNGFVLGVLSPSRTPHSIDQIEEKTTLLSVASSHDDRLVHNS